MPTSLSRQSIHSHALRHAVLLRRITALPPSSLETSLTPHTCIAETSLPSFFFPLLAVRPIRLSAPFFRVSEDFFLFLSIVLPIMHSDPEARSDLD